MEMIYMLIKLFFFKFFVWPFDIFASAHSNMEKNEESLFRNETQALQVYLCHIKKDTIDLYSRYVKQWWPFCWTYIKDNEMEWTGATDNPEIVQT